MRVCGVSQKYIIYQLIYPHIDIKGNRPNGLRQIHPSYPSELMQGEYLLRLSMLTFVDASHANIRKTLPHIWRKITFFLIEWLRYTSLLDLLLRFSINVLLLWDTSFYVDQQIFSQMETVESHIHIFTATILGKYLFPVLLELSLKISYLFCFKKSNNLSFSLRPNGIIFKAKNCWSFIIHSTTPFSIARYV